MTNIFLNQHSGVSWHSSLSECSYHRKWSQQTKLESNWILPYLPQKKRDESKYENKFNKE